MDQVTVEVNFSDEDTTTNCGAAHRDQVCISVTGGGKALVDLTRISAGREIGD